jgi:hypothetical protein
MMTIVTRDRTGMIVPAHFYTTAAVERFEAGIAKHNHDMQMLGLNDGVEIIARNYEPLDERDAPSRIVGGAPRGYGTHSANIRP